jgi:hypothetical protein
MKKVSLLVLLVFSFIASFSQTYPVTQILGSPQTLVLSKGGLKADSSLILPSFNDTSDANRSTYLNKYPGSIIRAGNQVWVRNITATQWLALATSGTAVGSVTSITQGYGITNTPNPITVTGTVKVDTTVATGLSGKYVRFTDTSVMLSKYLRRSDTSAMLLPYLRKADTSAMLSKYVRNTTTIATTAPLTGGGSLSNNLTLSMPAATTSVNGYLTSTNFTTFNNKENVLTFNAPLSRATNAVSITLASSTINGYLTATDWTTFNNKVSSTRSISTTSPLTGGGDLSANRVLAINQATSSQSGYLSSTDYNTFSNKTDTIYRTIGKDSIQFKINGRYYAIKDSSGGGGTVTRAVDTIYRTPGKDSIIFTINGTRRAIKDSVGSGGGGVTAVTASAPLSSSGGTTPNITISASGPSSDGYLTSTDFNSFNSRLFSIGSSGLITASGGGSPVVSTNMNANKLVGRNPSSSGEMQEITLGSGLSLTGTTLSATGGGGGGSQNLQQVLDTGYTLNGNFYFQTNTSDSVVNLSGTRLTEPRTYQFPDSSGILALKSDLLPLYYQIDLSASSYTMTNYGVYEIKTATDSTTPYYITFPDANDFVGQRITLTNADKSGYNNNAIIDTSGNQTTRPKYQGTDSTIWQIPYGMTYEFLSINGRWMSTNPMPVYTQDLWLDYDSYGEQYIPFGGIYKTYDAAPAKAGNYYRIWFPDPKKNNGERITLINSDTTYPIKIQGIWIPVSKSTYGGRIIRVPPQSTYEFVSIDSQWICVNMSTPPTYFNIDISSFSYQIPSNGVYFFSVTSATNGTILPANAEWYDGKTIILVNNDGTNALDITGAVNPDGTSYSSLAVGSAATLVSIGGKWIVISER